jgi:hypothetical protein
MPLMGDVVLSAMGEDNTRLREDCACEPETKTNVKAAVKKK